MNLEKMVFGFVIILACTLNFGFFIGGVDSIHEHDAGYLFGAVVVNLIALIMKFGDRTHLGATHLATSLVAMLQLLAASLVWMWHVNMLFSIHTFISVPSFMVKRMSSLP